MATVRKGASRGSSGNLEPAATDCDGDGSESLTLGARLEACRVIRARLRENEFKLVKWIKPELANKPSMAAIALNCRALTTVASWWCPRQKTPKSPSVLELKKEASNFCTKRMFEMA